MACKHLDFAASVVCNRLTKSDKEPEIIAYAAEIRINCANCGLPFEFIGVEAGLMPDRPMSSVDAQELRVPIRPKGLDLLPAIPGFRVKAN